MSRKYKFIGLAALAAIGWSIFALSQPFITWLFQSLHNPHAETVYYVIRYIGAAAGFVGLGLMLRMLINRDKPLKHTIALTERLIGLGAGALVAFIFWWALDLALLICLFMLPASWDSPNILAHLRRFVAKYLSGQSDFGLFLIITIASGLILTASAFWVEWDAMSFVSVIALSLAVGFSAGFIAHITRILFSQRLL